MTSPRIDPNSAATLDQLLSDALDTHAAGDHEAARAAWIQIEAMGPAAATSARRVQQTLQDLRATRMPVDLTDRVLARLETDARPAPGAASTTVHATVLPERRAPRHRMRLPRISGTTIAAILGLATVMGLLVFARPAAPTRFAAQPQPHTTPRSIATHADHALPTPGVQDADALAPQRLTLGDTSRYDANHVTPLAPWGASDRAMFASSPLPTPWWLASAHHAGLSPLVAAAPQDQTVLTPSQRAGQELMRLLEAHAQQIKQADEPIQRPR